MGEGALVMDPTIPVGIDGDTFHTSLHLLSIILLVYVVRHVTHDSSSKQGSGGTREQLDRLETKLSVLASNVAWTDNPRSLRETATEKRPPDA